MKNEQLTYNRGKAGNMALSRAYSLFHSLLQNRTRLC
jgi:hypothetical protein